MATNSSDQLNRAREAISKGDNKTAQQILAGILAQDNQSVEAWLLLSDVLENPEQRIESLKRVLQINPNNAVVKRRLDDLLGVSHPTINTDQSGLRKTSVPPKKKNNSLIIVLILSFLGVCTCISASILLWQQSINSPAPTNSVHAKVVREREPEVG